MKRMKELRLEKKLSQEKLAELLVIKQQSVNNYENGKFEPDISTLIQISRLFGVSVDYLIGAVDVRTPIDQIKPYELSEQEAELIENLRQLPLKIRNDIYNIVLDFTSPGNQSQQ